MAFEFLDTTGSAGATEELERIIGQIRERWPHTRIILRADSGFAREGLMGWCEAHAIHNVFGMARNKRLQRAIGVELHEAQQVCAASGGSERRFKELTYRSKRSWSRERRVVAKAEVTPKGHNPRFIVTSLSIDEFAGRELYEWFYCASGEAENRIMECQLDLFAHRLSTNMFQANQLRLWSASFAYVLLESLRRGALSATRSPRRRPQLQADRGPQRY